MTEYIVFEFLKPNKDEVGAWQIQVNLQARSARSAIRIYLSEMADADTEGRFVAVPARSWQPLTVKVEKALKFS